MKTTNIAIEQFYGVTDFLRIINNRKPNKVFETRGLASEENDKSFTMTSSYRESEDLMSKGYKEGLEKLEQAKSKKITASSKMTKPIPQVGIVGFAPHVPNAIAGIPQSMISRAVQTQKSKVINILYDCTESCSTPTSDFVQAGRNLLDLIVSLEANGNRVALDIMICACTRKQKVACVVRIKDYRQPINPLKVSYPLIHPSFFRRQGFKFIETSPAITDYDFADGYGHALKYEIQNGSTDCCRDYLKESGVLCNDVYFTNVSEAKCVESNDELARKMKMNIKLKD